MADYYGANIPLNDIVNDSVETKVDELYSEGVGQAILAPLAYSRASEYMADMTGQDPVLLNTEDLIIKKHLYSKAWEKQLNTSLTLQEKASALNSTQFNKQLSATTDLEPWSYLLGDGDSGKLTYADGTRNEGRIFHPTSKVDVVDNPETYAKDPNKLARQRNYLLEFGIDPNDSQQVNNFYNYMDIVVYKIAKNPNNPQIEAYDPTQVYDKHNAKMALNGFTYTIDITKDPIQVFGKKIGKDSNLRDIVLMYVKGSDDKLYNLSDMLARNPYINTRFNLFDFSDDYVQQRIANFNSFSDQEKKNLILEADGPLSKMWQDFTSNYRASLAKERAINEITDEDNPISEARKKQLLYRINSDYFEKKYGRTPYDLYMQNADEQEAKEALAKAIDLYKIIGYQEYDEESEEHKKLREIADYYYNMSWELSAAHSIEAAGASAPMTFRILGTELAVHAISTMLTGGLMTYASAGRLIERTHEGLQLSAKAARLARLDRATLTASQIKYLEKANTALARYKKTETAGKWAGVLGATLYGATIQTREDEVNFEQRHGRPPTLFESFKMGGINFLTYGLESLLERLDIDLSSAYFRSLVSSNMSGLGKLLATVGYAGATRYIEGSQETMQEPWQTWGSEYNVAGDQYYSFSRDLSTNIAYSGIVAYNAGAVMGIAFGGLGSIGARIKATTSLKNALTLGNRIQQSIFNRPLTEIENRFISDTNNNIMLNSTDTKDVVEAKADKLVQAVLTFNNDNGRSSVVSQQVVKFLKSLVNNNNLTSTEKEEIRKRIVSNFINSSNNKLNSLGRHVAQWTVLSSTPPVDEEGFLRSPEEVTQGLKSASLLLQDIFKEVDKNDLARVINSAVTATETVTNVAKNNPNMDDNDIKNLHSVLMQEDFDILELTDKVKQDPKNQDAINELQRAISNRIAKLQAYSTAIANLSLMDRNTLSERITFKFTGSDGKETDLPIFVQRKNVLNHKTSNILKDLIAEVKAANESLRYTNPERYRFNLDVIEKIEKNIVKNTNAVRQKISKLSTRITRNTSNTQQSEELPTDKLRRLRTRKARTYAGKRKYREKLKKLKERRKALLKEQNKYLTRVLHAINRAYANISFSAAKKQRDALRKTINDKKAQKQDTSKEQKQLDQLEADIETALNTQGNQSYVLKLKDVNNSISHQEQYITKLQEIINSLNEGIKNTKKDIKKADKNWFKSRLEDLFNNNNITRIILQGLNETVETVFNLVTNEQEALQELYNKLVENSYTLEDLDDYVNTLPDDIKNFYFTEIRPALLDFTGLASNNSNLHSLAFASYVVQKTTKDAEEVANRKNSLEKRMQDKAYSDEESAKMLANLNYLIENIINAVRNFVEAYNSTFNESEIPEDISLLSKANKAITELQELQKSIIAYRKNQNYTTLSEEDLKQIALAERQDLDKSKNNKINIFIKDNLKVSFDTLANLFQLHGKPEIAQTLTNLTEGMTALKLENMHSRVMINDTGNHALWIDSLSDFIVNALPEGKTTFKVDEFINLFTEPSDIKWLAYLFNFTLSRDSKTITITPKKQIAAVIGVSIIEFLSSAEFRKTLFNASSAAELQNMFGIDNQLNEEDIRLLQKFIRDVGIPESVVYRALGYLIIKNTGIGFNSQSNVYDNDNLAINLGAQVINLLRNNQFPLLTKGMSVNNLFVDHTYTENDFNIYFSGTAKSIKIPAGLNLITLNDAFFDATKAGTLVPRTDGNEFNKLRRYINNLNDQDTYIVWDTETATSRSKKNTDSFEDTQQIVQISAIKYRKDGTKISEFNFYVDFDENAFYIIEKLGSAPNPTKTLWEEAKKNNKLKTQQQVISEFYDFIKDSAFMVGYNNYHFDNYVLTKLIKSVNANALPNFAPFLDSSQKSLDLYVVAQEVFPYYNANSFNRNLKLVTLAALFSPTFNTKEAHNAIYDVEATELVLRGINNIKNDANSTINFNYQTATADRLKSDYQQLKKSYIVKDTQRDYEETFSVPEHFADEPIHNVFKLLKISKEQERMLELLSLVEYTLIDFEPFMFLLEPDEQKRNINISKYKQARGYIDPTSAEYKNLTEVELQEQIGINQHIDLTLEGWIKIIEVYNEHLEKGTEKDFKIYISRFFGKHGRIYMKGATINPQSYKEDQRYFIVAKNDFRLFKIDFNEESEEIQKQILYTISILFKLKPDQDIKAELDFLFSLETLELDILTDFYQFSDFKNGDEVKALKQNSILGSKYNLFKNIENRGQALAFISFLKNRKEAEILHNTDPNKVTSFKAWLPCEIDGASSGTFLKAVQFGALDLIEGKGNSQGLGAAIGVITHNIEQKFKSLFGIELPKTQHEIKALKGKKGLNGEEYTSDIYLDSALHYKKAIVKKDANGKEILDEDKLFSIIDTFKADTLNNLAAYFIKVLNDFDLKGSINDSKKTALLFVKALKMNSQDDELLKTLRDLFKDPTMTHNYGAGFHTITVKLAEQLMLKLVKKYRLFKESGEDINNITDEETKNIVEFFNSIENQYNITDLLESLKHNLPSEIVLSDSGYTLKDVFNSFVAASITHFANQYMEERYSAFTELNKSLELAAFEAYNTFNMVYEDRLKQLEENAKARGREITKKEYDDLMDTMREIFPSITPLVENHKTTLFFANRETVFTEDKTIPITYFNGTDKSTRSVLGTRVVYKGPGKSGSVLGIHNLDAFIAQYVTNTYLRLTSIFDAFIVNTGNIDEVAHRYNQGAFIFNMLYNLPQASYDMLYNAYHRHFEYLVSKEQADSVNFDYTYSGDKSNSGITYFEQKFEDWLSSNTATAQDAFGNIPKEKAKTRQQILDEIKLLIHKVETNKQTLFGHFDTSGTYIPGSIVRIQNMDGATEKAAFTINDFIRYLKDNDISSIEDLRVKFYRDFVGNLHQDYNNVTTPVPTSFEKPQGLQKQRTENTYIPVQYPETSNLPMRDYDKDVFSSNPEDKKHIIPDSGQSTVSVLERTASVSERIRYLYQLLLKPGETELSEQNKAYFERLSRLWQLLNPNSLMNVKVKLTENGEINVGFYTDDNREISLHKANRTLPASPGWNDMTFSVYNRQSLAEVYSHEVSHSTFVFGLKYCTYDQFRKIIAVWMNSKKHIDDMFNKEGWRIFLPDGFDTLPKGSPEYNLAVSLAKQTYDYVFTINPKNDVNAEMLHRLAEFFAYALTNDKFYTALCESYNGKSRPIIGKIYTIIKNIFAVIFGGKKFSIAFAETNAYLSGERGLLKGSNPIQDIQALYIQLSHINQRSADSYFYNKLNPVNVLDTVISALTSPLALSDYLVSKLIHAVTHSTDKYISPDFLRKLVDSEGLALLFNTTALSAMAFTNQNARDALLTILATKCGFSQEGIVLTCIREMRSKDSSTKELYSLHADRVSIERISQAEELYVYEILEQAFGRKLDKVESTLLYNVLFKSEAHNLVDNIFGNNATLKVEQLMELLDDVTKLKTTLNTTIATLHTYMDRHNLSEEKTYVDRQIFAIVNYMATKKVRLGQYTNPKGLVHYITKKPYVLDNTLFELIANTISLTYLVNKTSQEERRSVLALANNLNKKDFTGISTYLNLHHNYVKKAYLETNEKSLVYSSHINMGYRHNMFDNSNQILIDSTSKEVQAELAKKDYYLDTSYQLTGMAKHLGLGVYKRAYVTSNKITGGAFAMAGFDPSIWNMDRTHLSKLLTDVDSKSYRTQILLLAKKANEDRAAFASFTEKQIEKEAGDFIGLTGLDNITIENFSFSINEDYAINVMGQNTDGLRVLANLYGNAVRKVKARGANKILIEFLRNDFNKYAVKEKEKNGVTMYRHINDGSMASNMRYVQVTNKKYLDNGLENPNYSKYIADIWDKLPLSLRNIAEQEDLFIRDDWKLDLFGVESFSLVDTKLLSMTNKEIRLAVISMEQILKSFVRLTKQVILFKKPVVLLFNTLSNIALSTVKYRDPLKIIRYQSKVIKYTHDYLNLESKARRLEFLGETRGYNTKEELSELRKLQYMMSINPIAPLMEAGLFSGVAQDISEITKSDNAWLKRKIKEKFNFGSMPKGMLRIANELNLSQGTFFFNTMYTATQYSDFIARGAEYLIEIENPVDEKGHKIQKHNTDGTETKEFIDFKKDLIKELRERFVYYDTPVSKLEQYVNDMGLIWFAKYRKRIQSILINQVKSRPVTSLLMYLLATGFFSFETPLAGILLLSGLTMFRNPIKMFETGITPGIVNLI